MPHFKLLFKVRIKVESLHNNDGFFICLPELWNRLRSGCPDFLYRVLFYWELAHTQNTPLICRQLKKNLLNLGPRKCTFQHWNVFIRLSLATWTPIVKIWIRLVFGIIKMHYAKRRLLMFCISLISCRY